MTANDASTSTNIPVCASNETIARVLVEQYGHLESGEARALLEHLHAPVWTTDELLETFEVSHFEPPYVHVIRKEDGKRGTVMFTDSPRFYFAFAVKDNE